MSDRTLPATGRLLGLDLGEKRIGVAVSDENGSIASPVGMVLRGGQDIAELRKHCVRLDIVGIVVGLPTGMSGKEGPQAIRIREDAQRVAEALGLPLGFADERMTSIIAERSLRESGGKRQRDKGTIDSTAAAIILQGYIDTQRMRAQRMHRPGKTPPSE